MIVSADDADFQIICLGLCVSRGRKGTSIGPTKGLVLVEHTWFPNRFCCLRELGYIQICWAVTDYPRYPGYRTPTIAFELVVEWVAKAVHLVGGISGTHMSLQVPTRDSLVRSWDWSLHGRDSQSRDSTHHVALEVAAELESSGRG
jgi:hypothetical protein